MRSRISKYHPQRGRSSWGSRILWLVMGAVVSISILHFSPAVYGALSPLWPAQAPDTDEPPFSIDKQIFEREIFDYVNKVRVEHGSSPTVWDDTLYDKAQEICGMMAEAGHLVHHDSHSPWSENCYGSVAPYSEYRPDVVSPEGIVHAWLNSTIGHRHYLLLKSVKYSAVGVSFDTGFWVAWSFPRYGEPVGYSPWESWEEVETKLDAPTGTPCRSILGRWQNLSQENGYLEFLDDGQW